MVKPEIKKAIIDVYGGECQYCRAKGSNHVDHIVPKSLGGEDLLTNLILACGWCNLRRSNQRLAPEYEGLMLAVAKRNVVRVEKRVAESWDRPKTPPGHWYKRTALNGDQYMVWVPAGVTVAKQREAYGRLLRVNRACDLTNKRVVAYIAMKEIQRRKAIRSESANG